MPIKTLTDIEPIAAYLRRIDAEPRTLRKAVVKQIAGKYWRDVASIVFERDGTVIVTNAHGFADESYEPTPDERAAIGDAVRAADWPEYVKPRTIENPHKIMAEAAPRDLYVFRNDEGEIPLIQVRVEREGQKAYLPFTFWNDGEWRIAEPEGELPLYNAHRLKGASIVWIHEGAKAARACQELADDDTREGDRLRAAHPWGAEIGRAVHVGWIGGALNPGRTDWSPIERHGLREAFIVADNDQPGREAVPRISQRLNLTTFAIVFTPAFPVSFDLADPFPDELFFEVEGARHYNGPTLSALMHPATWATDLVTVGKNKTVPVLRDSFKRVWQYAHEPELFVCAYKPSLRATQAQFNSMVAAFSHAKDQTHRLMISAYDGMHVRICYQPGAPNVVVDNGVVSINTYTPSEIRPAKGDPGPWLEFMAYLIPDERERQQLLRWIATLIARPDVRMIWGVLLVSEAQGTGKTTLAHAILKPLVGWENCSDPGEAAILSEFNDWMGHKRLAVVSEIYQGHSWKSYQTLKSLITDNEVTINRKYQKPYSVRNYCHILASSNSRRALRMEADDRRWFYPEVTETAWPGRRFAEFRRWLLTGGLQIIRRWADDFGDYVAPYEIAPRTRRKEELIEDSRSDAQKEALAVAEVSAASSEPIALTYPDVMDYCRARIANGHGGRMFDTETDIRKAMIEGGLRPLDRKIKLDRRTVRVLCNPALYQSVTKGADEISAMNDLVRRAIRKPGDLMRDGEPSI